MDQTKPMHNHNDQENVKPQKKSSYNQHPQDQMPPPSKRSRPDDVDNISNRPTKRSKELSAQHLAVNKRPRPDGDRDGQNQAKPVKRAKVDQEHTLPPGSSTQVPHPPITPTIPQPTKPPQIPSTSQDQPLPVEVQHLSSKYDITTMSVISSSKLEHKIRNLLDRVSRFSFAEPNAKPGVVVLHAKAEVASKMISIVEIAKKEIEKEKGKWWQYSKLEGQIVELKKKKPSPRTGGGKTLGEWAQERGGAAGADVDKVEVDEDEDETKGATKAAAPRATTTTESQQAPHPPTADDDEDDDDDDDPADAFETMPPPHKITAADHSTAPPPPSRAKIRNTPLMTVYIARVPVPGLKELYG